jgi:hypothetical protein
VAEAPECSEPQGEGRDSRRPTFAGNGIGNIFAAQVKLLISFLLHMLSFLLLRTAFLGGSLLPMAPHPVQPELID